MFAQTSAATAATSRTAALPVSVRRKPRSGVSRFRTQAVRPVNGDSREALAVSAYTSLASAGCGTPTSWPPGQLRASTARRGLAIPIAPTMPPAATSAAQMKIAW